MKALPRRKAIMRTIIHIFSTIDGRISGPFMTSSADAESRAAYARIREDYAPDAILYGSMTSRAFAGNAPAQPMEGTNVPDGDFVEHAVPELDGEYLVNLDPAGEVWWKEPVLRRAGHPDATVVEVVTGTTPGEFLAYLRSAGVPYIIAGDDRVDCAEMLDKLERLLGMETLLVCGGGKADWMLLEAGCVDEVSVVITPVASGEAGVATLFDQMPGTGRQAPIALSLSKAERVEGDGLHVVYRPCE